MSEMVAVFRVYQGSDGEATKVLYARLEQLDPVEPWMLCGISPECSRKERERDHAGEPR